MEGINIRILDIIDILIFAILIGQIYNLVKGTVAIKIFIGILSIYVSWYIVSLLNMTLLSETMGKFMDLGVLALVIVFQKEIRDFLIYIGNSSSRKHIFKKLKILKTEISNQKFNISQIIEACEEMSKTKTGALIVMLRNDKLNVDINPKNRVKIEINKIIIENIFFKNSPLHDGAMIIKGNDIIGVSIILSFPDEAKIPKINGHIGLRHKAAIGTTIQIDAVCIVVSEERGDISYVKEGKLTRVNCKELNILLNKDFEITK